MLHRQFDAGHEFEIGEQQSDAEGHPDLRQHGVLRCSDEASQLEVLLDPLEEEFDLPAGLIEVGDGLCGQVIDIGQELVEPSGLGASVADQAKRLERPLRPLFPDELDLAVESQVGVADRIFAKRLGQHVAPCPCDEKDAAVGQILAPAIVAVAFVKDEN